MPSIKLSITCRSRLQAKYDAGARARIDAAVAAWTAADKARGIRTVHVAVDDAAAMKAYKVPAVRGTITAGKVKKALDGLVARLAPDYIVLFGAGDVVPQFEVPNPTGAEDNEPKVPTDNPYASSQQFRVGKRASYLVPDRVVGRLPDLPGSGDSTWLLDYLTVATQWRGVARARYAKDLLVCCDTWKNSGRECVTYIGHNPSKLMISPPSDTASKSVRSRHSALLHMVKCHGGVGDSAFYGQKGQTYPEVLRSTALLKRTKRGTVAGAMCCYGASVFDPSDPGNVNPGEPPIASVYLKQGAFGFFGATSTAWVGDKSMMCADWVAAAFLKAILSGASLGRAALETKQDFIRWTQEQGHEADSGDEKTLLQFVLLGDPSIHPVHAALPASRVVASRRGATSGLAVTVARRKRRGARLELAEVLRAALPELKYVRAAHVPDPVHTIARALARTFRNKAGFKLGLPRIQRVVSKVAMAPASTLRGRTRAAKVVNQVSFQYYWAKEQKGGPVRNIRMVSIQADAKGNVLRAQALVSS